MEHGSGVEGDQEEGSLRWEGGIHGQAGAPAMGRVLPRRGWCVRDGAGASATGLVHPAWGKGEWGRGGRGGTGATAAESRWSTAAAAAAARWRPPACRDLIFFRAIDLGLPCNRTT